MALQGGARTSWATVARTRAVSTLLVGNFVSTVGTQVQQAVVAWLVFRETNSSAMVGLLVLAQQIPMLFLTLPAGMLADNHDRKRLLFITQAGLMTSSAALAVLLATDHASVPVLVVATAIVGAGAALTGPAWIAELAVHLPPDVVYAGYSLNSVTAHSAVMLGPPLGALLLRLTGSTTPIVVNTMSFAAILIAVALLPRRQVITHDTRSRASLAEVVDFVRRSDRARRLLPVCAAIAAVTAGLPALLPAYATTVLHGDASRYGQLLGAMGAGSLLGGILIGVVSVSVARRQVMFGAAWAIAVGVTLLAVAPNTLVALLGMFGVGLGNLMLLVTARTVIQLDAPPHLQGRALSMWFAATVIATPIGSVALGWATDRLHPRTITGMAAAYSAVLALALVAVGRRRTVVPFAEL